MKIRTMSSWKGIKNIKNQYLWTGVVVFLLFFSALLLVQFSTPGLVGNDGYYHIKISYLIRTQGLKPTFEYLPLSVLNPEEFVDHHYLFHLLMVPFTFGDLRIGAKLASVFFPALAFVSIWWMLKKQQVEYPFLWSLGLLAISEAFLYRMSMPRAQSLSLLFLVLAFHSMLEMRHRTLILLGILYVWSYNAFPLLLIVATAYVAANWLVNKLLNIKPLLYSSTGLVLGLVINPYFPKNIVFIYRHIAPKLVDATSVSVGNEWFPYTTSTLLENSGLAFFVFILGVIALGLNEKKINLQTTTSLFLVIVFGFMLFQSRRFVEYAPPIMLIFAAFAWSPVIHKWKQNSDRLGKESANSMMANLNQSIILLAIPIALLMISVIWYNLSTSRKAIQEKVKPYQRFADASEWLQNNTPAKSRVFQTDWDDFPQLFFYNTHNTYTIGLDPTYMQSFNSDLYDQWVAITKGKVENPSEAIQDQFGGEYIISDLKHKNFLREAEADEQIALMYEDDYAVVFQVLP